MIRNALSQASDNDPSNALNPQQRSALLQYISDTPQKGSWQYGMRPNADGSWDIHSSPPDSDQWGGPLTGSTGLDLGSALSRLNLWRMQTR